ncbi:exported hypothetical protein [Frankia sp. AiPs1]|nr:pentapeptide repeat-containing protein [Frankia sp. AiPa1]MCL9759084.1 pentapeptide repeat-containing protein [Frankia sp. AiPa1]
MRCSPRHWRCATRTRTSCALSISTRTTGPSIWRSPRRVSCCAPPTGAGTPRSYRHAGIFSAPGWPGRTCGGADLSGRLLLGADLRRADLRAADLRGADLRGADLRGADLRGTWFLTSMQLASARGDLSTRLSAGHDHPAHWTATPTPTADDAAAVAHP